MAHAFMRGNTNFMRRWDDQKGDWQGLQDSTQLPRYHAIATLLVGRMRVLDIGCGEALLARHLLPGVQYQGVEPSRTAFEEANKHAPVTHSTAEAYDIGAAR